MPYDRNKADQEVLVQIVLWAQATVMQIERLEQASEDARQASDPWPWGQAPADRYFDEQAEKVFLLVAANHLVTALRVCKTKRLKVPVLSPEMRATVERLRDVYEHWDEHYLGQQRGDPPKKGHQRLLDGQPEALPWATRWTLGQGLTLAGILKLKDLRAEVVNVGEGAWTAYETLLRSDGREEAEIQRRRPRLSDGDARYE